MTEPIKRYETDINEWSPEDFLNHTRTGVKPERVEYTNARQAALEDANLEDVDDDVPVPVEDMDAAQHLKRIQGR
jgi:hypothetical protein